MTPGPTLILKCQRCPTLVPHRTIASGNTFGATFYTDGQRVAPMMPISSYLVSCPDCGTVQRLKDMKEVDSYRWRLGYLPGEKSEEEIKEAQRLNEQKQDQYEDLPSYERATATDYFEFASSHPKDKKEEIHLRVLGWRIGNDARRKGENAVELDMLEIDNLRRILHLTEGDSNFPQILIVEIYRELGLFDEAEALLKQLEAPESEISEFERESLPFYINLVNKKDSRVQELIFN